MDIKALQADLLALKKLYALLMMNRQDEMCEPLDAGSRVFLKNLLDAAAERFFESHSQMVVAEPSIVATCQTTRLHHGSLCTMNASPVAAHGINDDHPLRHTIGRTTKKLFPKLNAEMNAADLLHLSRLSIESQNRNKHYQVLMAKKQMRDLGKKNQLCDQDFDTFQKFGANKTVEELDAQEEVIEELGSSTCGYQYNLSDAESVACCSVRCVVHEGGPKRLAAGQNNVDADAAAKMDGFSDEVVVKMKRIESLLRSLQLPTEPDNTPPYEKNARSNLGLTSDNYAYLLGMKQGVASREDASKIRSCKESNLFRAVTSNTREHREEAKLEDMISVGMTQKKNMGSSVQGRRLSEIPEWRRVRANLTRIESLRCSATQNDSLAGQTPEPIQGLRFTLPLSQFDEEDEDNTHSIRDAAMSRSPAPAPSVGSTNFAQIRARGRNAPQSNLPEKKIASHATTHSHYKYSAAIATATATATASQSNKNKAIVRQMANVVQRNKVLPYHQQSEEEEETSWGSPISYASSSRTSYDSRGSEEEEESQLSDDRLISQHLSSSSGRIPRHIMVHESSSEYDVSTDNNSHNQGMGMDMGMGRPHRVGMIKSFKSNHRVEKVSGAGRLRRIKNKLGMIFHHHHHHHHHHHGYTEEDEVGLAKSLWRLSLGKIFQHKVGTESEKKKVEDSRRRPVTKSIKRKQQGWHFHALVDGLMRHIRRPDKSKLAKEIVIKRPGNIHRGGRKGVNGLSLWQKLHGQHGLKLSNRGPVKLRSKTRRPQLSMANMHLRR
ncbi:hypothetical protein Dimus_011977 [Dionaea muscipula]